MEKVDNETSNKVVKDSMNKLQTFNMYVIFLSFIIAAGSIAMGFYKMFVYRNTSSDSEYFISTDLNKNAYVGADAYNYIINGTYTTSYFVLGLIFTVIACSVMITQTIINNRK